MRRLFLAGNDANLDFLESRRLQPSVQIALSQAQTAVAIQLVGALKIVLRQIENQDRVKG
jgi:hypothetical protein